MLNYNLPLLALAIFLLAILTYSLLSKEENAEKEARKLLSKTFSSYEEYVAHISELSVHTLVEVDEVLVDEESGEVHVFYYIPSQG